MNCLKIAEYRVETVESKSTHLGPGWSDKWFKSGRIVHDHVQSAHPIKPERRRCARVNFLHGGMADGGKGQETKGGELTALAVSQTAVGGGWNRPEKRLAGDGGDVE